MGGSLTAHLQHRWRHTWLSLDLTELQSAPLHFNDRLMLDFTTGERGGKKANMPTSLLWFHQRGALVDAPFTWSGNIREHWERRRRRRTFSPANACLDSDGEVWVSLNFHKDSWMRWCQSAESPKTATAPTTRGRRQNVQYPWKHWTLEKLFLDVFPVHTNVENIMIIHKKI